MTDRPLVFSIQGPHGVGKSILLKELGRAFPRIRTCAEGAADLERTKRPEEAGGLSPETFAANQRLFIAWEIRRWASFAPGDVVVIDRGPEATEFYTLHYPAYRGAEWNPASVLVPELADLRKCRSTAILYLTATEECLRRRAGQDARARPTFERWLRHFEPLARDWFHRLPNCAVLDTTLLTSEEVFSRAVDWMDQHGARLVAHGSEG
jgi:hypothetical protein